MSSSGAAVFTRSNPFPPDPPLQKTHYRPSLGKISKQARKTTLSPVRLTQRSSPDPPMINSQSTEDQHFLRAAHHFVHCPPDTEGQTSFSESWPSIDLGSSPINTPASRNKDTPTWVPTSGVGKGESRDSVLAKYIERFRHGRPQSREERRQTSTMAGEGQQPFWWLSPSPLPSSSTPTQTSDKGSDRNNSATTLSPVQYDAASFPSIGLLDLSAMEMSDSSHCDLGDPELLQLQNNASKLLLQSEQSLSSGSMPISSEGLGCSDSLSPVSIAEPVRRPLASSVANLTPDIYTNFKPIVLNPPASRTRPEEDILFQWRLRRKIEQARQWSQTIPHQPSVIDLQAQKVHQNPLPDPLRAMPSLTPEPQETSGPFPPATAPVHPLNSSHAVSKLRPTTVVPPHMHLLCDILPCPTHSPSHSHQRSPSRREVPGAERTSQKPKTQTQSRDTSSSKRESSPATSSLSETTEEEGLVQQKRTERARNTLQKEVARSEKRTRPSLRNQISARHNVGDGVHPEKPRNVSRHGNRGPDRATHWREEPSRDVGQQERRPVCEGCPGDRAPPPSPIHSALGQVISERPQTALPCVRGPQTLQWPYGRGCSLKVRTVETVDSADETFIQNPLSAAFIPRTVQMLTPAYRTGDSDERDFEEDPLLRVLRQQRKWVKEQICEVNSLLNEFQEK
ncbi:hypothetical protein DPEC_G00145290 [Dallia pectoralis]|uniref:Uncharacterized protein n=1 Tax=Dallia pectoralis TaxID=75939 RepID=A0ACC2GNJ3_DALPE|nr:hypothetical protein DPEC_G00145290 [Dallia pectoralis]